ncbi:putative phosphatidylethanolamine-binding protein [Helianthus annuus]|nr:putative phosphatidylethanolamine-binding protein [Helianthus annuus]KAJ0670340.1 putative phosphatidylethanolamine-binding protein [Helianthus annuus]
MIEPLALGRVIGEVVDIFTPCVKLNVTYNLNKTVSNGHELMPNLITSKPLVNIGGEDMRSAYTLVTILIFSSHNSYLYSYILVLTWSYFELKIMTDLDVPGHSDPYLREHLHWEIMSYETPKPLIGIHRYVFLLFKQKTRKSVSPPTSRDRFNTRNFSQQHGLGLPVAVVYFNAQRENATHRR